MAISPLNVEKFIPQLLEVASLMELRSLAPEYPDMRLQRLKTAVPIC